jgi:2-polyprenyl-3-methyl-5-hydroxy-6-metoxy-1,4-benzoquinol methylase
VKMLNRNCPICSTANNSVLYAEANFNEEMLDQFAFASRKIPEYMHHRLAFCENCDLIYANPIPEEDELLSAYTEADYDSSIEADLASKSYADILKGFLNNLADKHGAIDIGTGNGSFLVELLQVGFTGVIGVEPSEAPILRAAEEVRPLIKKGFFDSQDFEENSFSLITCFQTIEHLTDPLSVSRSVFNLLKDGGAAFFICHNHRALSAKLLKKKSPIFDIEHLQLFSPESGKNLLKAAGFKNIEVKRVINTYPINYWIKLFPFPYKLKTSLMNLSNKSNLGNTRISIPAGNIALIGYK